ncbi:WD domain, G-beta repeat containing protein [Coccidioides posadasii C735 delta SOWgp]|uniref:WD domain, G-beta repeat containing protein n=1 Tax=Coccidioides posadasii (strain C735) TaxID=222929 RepID=C5PJ99_COCP7|nr:WD domain, G-beta repeat containing protein [Coccidioides posadasii C735 delta SOWgp]EER23048.1 WD domain, G-beta repeat containing protein [Coccidioides posadasii C735 delta SOWgp]|eukprot:XP_003065193.1 WD domain, G-beta repeat containing protein [Coccidioides posadasii C735 delta SOWgp]
MISAGTASGGTNVYGIHQSPSTPGHIERVTSMSCVLENLDACLPITAIQVLNIPGYELTLSGHGPYVIITNGATDQVLERCYVFQRNNVHGIQILDCPVTNPECKSRVLVWGGQSLRLLQICIKEPRTEGAILLSTLSSEYVCPDWILDASFYSPPGGTPKLPSAYIGCLITAHNVVLGLELNLDVTSSEVSFHLHEIAPGLKPILYSADIAWTSPSDILVAAGTVFGEIIVWTCRLEHDARNSLFSNFSIFVHRFFTGHEGSIFGVNISEEVHIGNDTSRRRFLASCSDDRTIRIWDISACCSPTLRNPGGLSKDSLPRSTGFGAAPEDTLKLDQQECVAKTMCHASRIWGVYFLDISFVDGQLVFNVLSRGEDATCQVWSLNLKQDVSQEDRQISAGNTKMDHVSTHAYHTGKNIWSTAIFKDVNAFNVYSGGADGNLVSFTLDRNADTLRILGEIASDYSADEVVNGLGLKDEAVTGKGKKEGRIACYSFVSDESFIAVTTRGKALLGRVSPGSLEAAKLPSTPLVSWSMITTLEGGEPQYLAGGSPRKGMGIIGAPSGAIWLYDHSRNAVDKIAQTGSKLSGIFVVDGPPDSSCSPGFTCVSFVTAFVHSPKAVFFTARGRPDPELLFETVLNLPPNFLITAASFMQTTSWLVLGSRHGGIAIYALDMASSAGQIDPLFYSAHLHANDAITSIISLRSYSAGQGAANYIVTTGRDGYYQLHLIKSPNGRTQSVTVRTIHKACPPFGPNIEGAALDPKTNDLILYGFKGVYFIVWNESTQTELMAAECGGCHRVWTYHSNDEGRRVLIWTKASRLHLFSSQGPSHRVLRAGGHGREIKSACLSSLLSNDGQTRSQILATGAEDTTIRLFLPEASGSTQSGDIFRCQMTLKKHTAGIQHIQWSPCGELLFSSSGCEELYVWRISSIPGFGIGAMFMGECPKSKPISDLRVTHFDVVKLDDEDAFLLALAYSNSMITIFYFKPDSQEDPFELIARGQYSTNCLTYIRFAISGERIYLITTSTDGHLAIWDATNSLESVIHAHGNIIQRQLASKFPAIPLELACGDRHAIHQSSIKVMEMLQVSETELLVLCGGDDNALSASMITLSSSYPTTSEDKPLFYSTLLPQAHASAITAIAVIGGIKYTKQGFDVSIASSGNDQRLKIWCVQVTRRTKDPEIVVALKQDTYTAVADVSSIEVLTTSEAGEEKNHLVVCGVGMDMWKVAGNLE